MVSTVSLLIPITGKAGKWVQQNVHHEDWQKRGDGIAIEHGFIDAIITGMEEAGLVQDEDFSIQ